MTRKPLPFVLLLVLHYVLTWSALLYLNDQGWERFDHGGSPGSFERVVEVVYLTQTLPLTHVLLQLPGLRRLPALWGHVPFLLNSALWAGAILWLVRRVRRRDSTSTAISR